MVYTWSARGYPKLIFGSHYVPQFQYPYRTVPRRIFPRMICSLGSRPSPYVRVLIARGWANRRTVPRARPVVQAWHVIFLIAGFFDSLFLADGGAKSKTIGCWVRRRPLLPSSHMVSFSFSTIDYKSLTYGGRFRAYNRFPYRQKQLFLSKR